MTATALRKAIEMADVQHSKAWHNVCSKADLVEFSGVAAWLETAEGPAQVALFYLPGKGLESELFALDNHDPFSNAHVIARGIIGDLKGATVVASPLYKQHFRLDDGQCLEDENVKLRTWKVAFKGDDVWIEE